jgi:hypothetical protein
MAKSKMGSPRDRMSSVVSGDRSVRRTPSTVYAQSPLYNPEIGMPSTRTTFGTAPGKTNLQTASGSYPRIGFNAITPPGTSSRSLAQKFSTKYTPGEYAAYRKALAAKKAAVAAAKPVVKPTAKKPATVVSNVTNEKLTPAKAAPARMAVNARTGNTTGFTTGKTTGTTASKPGVAGKTAQSAFGRQMANAMNRGNQPAGPMGGGGGRMGGGTGPSRSGGGGNLGGARGRISEPGGSKR